MQNYKKSPHNRLQRRVLIGAIIFAIVAAAIAIPLITNEDLRYNLAMQSGQIPGKSVEKLADGESGALLIVLPLDHEEGDQITRWLFQAQFIAWPTDGGIELENLEDGDRATLPIDQVDFISSNGDGSLVFIRGSDSASGEPVAITVESETMAVADLPDPEATPEVPGDWDTSIWDKKVGWCHRPSPNKRFLACFVPSELASYAAGDWELNLQFWGDYNQQFPIFRGQGFLPWVGFANHDTVMYFQNERGIWRAMIPAEILDTAPDGTPFATPSP